MKRVLATTAIAGLMLVGAAPAFGASPSQRDCEAAGGTFTRDGGTVTCVYPEVSDPVGNSERSGGKSQTVDTQETESSNGTLNNKPKHKESTTCSGPGNSQSGC
jgi:hypothetical protein